MMRPVMLKTDLAAWRLLYLGAREVCAHPSVQHKAVAFARAGLMAKRAVFPDQAADTIKACTALIGFAMSWRACDLATRRANTPQILKLAAEVAARVGDGPTTPQPPTPVAASRLAYKDDTRDDGGPAQGGEAAA